MELVKVEEEQYAEIRVTERGVPYLEQAGWRVLRPVSIYTREGTKWQTRKGYVMRMLLQKAKAEELFLKEGDA